MTHDPAIDPDLARASTLPARAYTDPETYARELQLVFGKTWQPVGRAAQVREAGDFFTAEIAGKPIVVARGEHGELRAFYNVCRHRAGPVARGCGRRKSLQCAYHGWTYGLDGALLATPELEGVAGFDKADHGLVPVRAAAWGPFVFACLDAAAPPLEAWLGRIPEEVAPYRMEAMTFCERREWTVRCNWKVYMDNYHEGYHLPTVHPGLFRELDYSRYRVVPFEHYSQQFAPIRAAKAGGEPRHYAQADGKADALYYGVFPNWMLNLYPDNVSINIVIPLAVDRTLTVFEWYFADPSAEDAIARTVRFSEEIQDEDIAICEAVQKGLASGAYDRGRFSVAREAGVHHFQSLVERYMRAGRRMVARRGW